MLSFTALLLCLVLLVTSVSASSAFNIPLTKLQRTASYPNPSPNPDRARAAFLKTRSANGPTSVPATNQAYAWYTTSVGIGSPPTNYNLVIDTLASNTFCGTGTPYVRTSTSIPTGEHVGMSYGPGYFSGMEYLDQVTLAPNLVITNQSIADAISYADFPGVDGILGLGPVDLTVGTLSPATNATIPTVMNNLVSQGLIEHQVIGVYFPPATCYNDTNGVLTYGGTDSSLYEGELTYIPVTETSPSSYYWGINVTSLTYGTTIVIPSSTAGIVDIGTPQVLLADDLFSVYMNAIPGALLDNTTGLLEIPPEAVPMMDLLDFEIADRTFTMDVAAQLIPINQSMALGGDPSKLYASLSPLGSFSQEGLDFIIGQKFIERYYSVFDAENHRVGFAQTKNTFSVYQGYNNW